MADDVQTRDEGKIPEHVSEVDRLRLENALLQRDNLTLQEERLVAELGELRKRKSGAIERVVVVSRELAERYQLTPGRDRIEEDGRIVRVGTRGGA